MPLPRDVVVLSDDQFNKLVELLTPGFECAKLMLADYQQRAQPEPEPETVEFAAAETDQA